MGHKKKKHIKNYNKNSNKINITIHNDTKHHKKRRSNKKKVGISSSLGQHVQNPQPYTNTVQMYDAKNDQSDLVNQISNDNERINKKYNALLENVAEEQQQPQILPEPPKDNFMRSIMDGIFQRGGISIDFPKKEQALNRNDDVDGKAPRREHHPHVKSDLINVLNQEEANIQAATDERENEPENVLDLNEKAVEIKKPRGRPKGTPNKPKVEAVKTVKTRKTKQNNEV